MGNSISNNSTNINVKNDYKNRNYGSTINGSYGNRPQVTFFNNTPVAMDEYDLSGPMVIKEQDVLMKSEVTEQIENWINYLDNTRKTLEEEKDTLTDKARRFTDSANRGEYPDLYYEENTKGRKKYLNPKDAIKSDKYFKKYLKENGYSIYEESFTTDEYNLLKQKYANYINTVYAEKYSKYFNEATGMTYEDYKERLTQIYSDIESIKASRYELVQQAKEQPYIELMDTDDFKNYVANNKNNTSSELYKLYGIKNGTVPLDDDSYWRFTYFTEQDVLIFSYLWDTQSPKAAREYVEAIEDKLNKAEGLANAEKFLDSIRDENGNIDPDVWAGVLSGAKGFENGLSTFFEGLGNVFNGEGMMSTSQYEQMYILSELTNSSGNYVSKLAQEMKEKQGEEVAADFISKIYNKETNTIDLEYAKTVLSEQEYNNLVIKINTDKKSILDNVYELSSSAGNMLPSMLVSMAVSAVATPAAGSVVGSTLMGISSGGNSKNQALVQGNDLFTSTMYGVFSGVSETTLGLLLGNIPGLNESATFSFKGFVKEGMEEMLQEYVDAGLRASILDETIDLDQLGEDAFKSFIYGVVMSGIMNGGQVAFTAITAKGSIKITNIREAITFAKENGIDISEIEGNMMETKQNSTPNISSTIETSTSSSISSTGVDIESQIAKANMYTEKGNFASIDVPDISMMTDEVLSSIKNIDSVRFRLQDGSVIDIASLLNKRNSAKMDSVLSEVSSKTSSTISSNIESQIASITIQTEKGNSSSISYSKGVSLAQYVKQYLSSNMRKFLYKDTSNFVGLNEQIMQNGLYHFTTKVDKIIASGYIKASDFIASYASPLSPTLKSFFFNGIPEVGAVATNLDSVPVKATAIKIDPTPELVQSSKLKLRYMDDMAITYDGKFNLDGYNVQKCFFGLDIEDGKLVYKSISEAEYQNYENTSTGKMLSDYVSDKKNLTAIKSDFFTKIFEKNGISNIIDNGVSSPIVFKDKFEVARSFGDAKQLAYLELRKLFNINDIDSIPKDLLGVFYKVDANGKILYFDKNGKPTTKSDGYPSISSQSTIKDDIIFAAAEKYLSPELVSEINGYRTDPNNNIERLKKIKTVKSVIEGYTHKNGPAIAAFLRKNIVKFLSAEYDGNNPKDLESMINKSDAANGRTDISDFRMKDYVAVMDHAIASSSPTKKAMVVYRGVDQLFDGNTMLDPKSLEIGQVISDKAFLSTALLPTTSITDSRNIMIKINVPEGSKGLYVESLTGVAGYGQQEFLLPRDSKLRVTNYYFEDPSTGKIFLEMELLPNNDSSIGVDLPFIIKEKMGILSREDFTKTGTPTGELSTAELNVTEVKGEGSEPTFELPESELSIPQTSSKISFDNLSFLRVLNFDLIKVKDSFAKYYERIRTSKENGQRYRVNENTQVDFTDMIKDFYDMGYLKVLNESMVDMNNSNAYNPGLSNQEHGVDHAERVLTFASYIGLKSDLSAREMSILIESSKWHDCGRVVVASDTEHAIKSAEKIKDLIGERYSIRDIDMIKAAIELHEIDEGKCNYDDVFNSVCNKYSIDASDKNSLRVISDILKDADALDRLRFTFGNLDPTLLRKEISLNLIKASCQLQEARGFTYVSRLRDQNVVNILRQKGWSDYEISYGFKYRSDIIARAIQ